MRSRGLRPTIKLPADHLPTDTCKTDPALAAVVDAWPDLPEAIRVGILAMVKAARS
jgi:hypothetical protein